MSCVFLQFSEKRRKGEQLAQDCWEKKKRKKVAVAPNIMRERWKSENDAYNWGRKGPVREFRKGGEVSVSLSPKEGGGSRQVMFKPKGEGFSLARKGEEGTTSLLYQIGEKKRQLITNNTLNSREKKKRSDKKREIAELQERGGKK